VSARRSFGGRGSRSRQRLSRSRERAFRGAARLSAAFAALALFSCGPPRIPEFPLFEVAVPEPAEVEEVIFLLGDAGNAEWERSALLRDLSRRIEYWSGAVARDSAVSVLFLGDLVYPSGVHDRTSPSFEQDSVRLWSQIRLLSGPEARASEAIGLFLTGNHDWGNMQGPAGIERLENLAGQIQLAREGGLRVKLVPDPGEPGPEVIDLRTNTRILAIDTNWFLQSTSQRQRDEFLARVLTALEGAEDRHVIMAAHHPWASAGEHGVIQPVGEALGLVYLLKKSGTLVQDLNSPIYNELRARLRTAFTAADRVPLAYVAGHDHSLQVIEGDGDEFEPRFQLVSGAGSKATRIQEMEELKWGSPHLGFMMLFLLENEAAQLFVVATDSDVLLCPEEPPERDTCLEEETARFQLRYSEMLASPASLPVDDSATTVPDSTRGRGTGGAPPDAPPVPGGSHE